MLPVWVIASLSVVAIVLIVIGLRGVRIDRAPICKRCGFDLTGLGSSPGNCPECGRFLRTGDVRYGHRRRRPRFVWIGVLLLLPLAISIGSVGLGSARVVSSLPTTTLIWLAGFAGDGGMLTELNTRIAAGGLSQAQADGLVQAALGVQERTSLAWSEEWGNVVDAAIAKGMLKPEDVKRYLMHATPLKLGLQPRVRQGEVPYFDVGTSHVDRIPHRVGKAPVTLRLTPREAKIGDIVWPLQPEPFESGVPGLVRERKLELRCFGTGFQESMLQNAEPFSTVGPVTAPVGTYTATIVFDVVGEHPLDTAGTKYTWSEELQAPIEVRAPNQPIADLVTNPAALAEMKSRMTVQVWQNTDQENFCPAIRLTIKGASVDLVAQVEVWSGDQSWLMKGYVTQWRGNNISEFEHPRERSSRGIIASIPKTVRVVLRPLADMAAQMGRRKVIGAPIVFDDVPLLTKGIVRVGEDSFGGSGRTAHSGDGVSVPAEPDADALPAPAPWMPPTDAKPASK
jgi:hypothetical protein